MAKFNEPKVDASKFAVDVGFPRCGDFEHPEYGACAIIAEEDIPRVISDAYIQGMKAAIQMAKLLKRNNISLTINNLDKALGDLAHDISIGKDIWYEGRGAETSH